MDTEDNEARFLPAGEVYWLIQSRTTVLASSSANLLSQAEQAIFATLKTEKRRHDWLLGRHTAKHLIQQVAQQRTGQTTPLTTFSILGRADGSPEVIWNEPSVGFDCTISISHSADTALCALLERADWPLGADIERIDPRIMGFIGDYLTAAERDLISQLSEALRPLHTTAIWSAKEAVLKALRVGLKQDTRTLSCLISPVAIPPDDWLPFKIQWEASTVEWPTPLSGWWRVQDGFVLTLALL